MMDDVPVDLQADSSDLSDPEFVCILDADCDDGLYCDGVESCEDGVCREGQAVDCDDDDPCTMDSCVEAEGECANDTLDSDGDGYPARETPAGVACGGNDCDDAVATVHPGAALDCTAGGDFDCDGQIDGDEDHDGYLTVECPGGVDCDDTRADVYPGAVTDCSEIDHDCNGNPDRDDDGDGDTGEACGGDDCDDGDPLIFSFQIEIDCSGIDDNCDGNMSEIEDMDADGHSIVECGGDDCDDEDADVHPGVAETCNGTDDDCDGACDNGFACCGGRTEQTCTTVRALAGTRDCTVMCYWTPCCTHQEHCANTFDDDCDGEVDEIDLLGTPIRLTNEAHYSARPSSVWASSQTAIVWEDGRDDDLEIYFQFVDPTGVAVASPTRVTATFGDSEMPAIEYTGSDLAIGWIDYRDGHWDVFIRIVHPDGSAASSELKVSDSPRSIGNKRPSLAWTGSEIIVAWREWGPSVSGPDTEKLMIGRISPDGSKVAPDAVVVEGFDYMTTPAIGWTGSQISMVWSDMRLGRSELYYMGIGPDALPIGSDVQLMDEPGDSMDPVLSWTGSVFGLAWTDAGDGSGTDILFSIMSASGSMLGSVVQLSEGEGVFALPRIAWSGSTFGISWLDVSLSELYLHFERIDPYTMLADSGCNMGEASGMDHSVTWMGSTFGVFFGSNRDGEKDIYVGVQGCL